MKRKLLNIIILTLIFSALAFSQSNFMDYNIIDIKPIETNIVVPFITNLQTNRIFSNSLFRPGTNIYNDDFTHRHSLGIDFGTTIFSMFTAPSLVNLTLKSIYKEQLKNLTELIEKL